VQVAVGANLVAGGGDGAGHSRVVLGDEARDKERRRHAAMLEQSEQARHADARPVFALRHRGEALREGGILGERGGLAVDVEAEHHGAAFAAGPGEAGRRGKGGIWNVEFGSGVHSVQRPFRIFGGVVRS
jgi:hypothetical protein